MKEEFFKLTLFLWIFFPALPVSPKNKLPQKHTASLYCIVICYWIYITLKLNREGEELIANANFSGHEVFVISHIINFYDDFYLNLFPKAMQKSKKKANNGKKITKCKCYFYRFIIILWLFYISLSDVEGRWQEANNRVEVCQAYMFFLS